MAGAYQVFVVDMDGSQFGELANVEFTPPYWELNGIGGVGGTIPTTEPTAALLQFGREIQIWRDGAVLWWGPIVRLEVNLWQTTWRCAGLAWYFKRRFMGKADRTNLLVNGDFEDGETGWTFNNVTHSADTTHVVEGTHALKLTGLTTDGENWAKQIYTHAAASFPFPVGDFLTLNAWLWVASSGYVAPPIGLRGLFAEHRNAAGETLNVYIATPPLDDDLPKDQWATGVGLEVGLPNVNAGDTIDVRLYAPNGSCWWDLATLTAMESLAFGWQEEVDLADIIEGIVLYAQDRFVFTHGKSDLLIDVAWVGDAVLHAPIAFQFVEHRNIGDTLNELVRSGQVDMSVEITDTTRTWTTHNPRKGSYKSGDTLQLDTNISTFTWSFDGEAAATDVVITGPGDGPDRPEGGASDPSAFGGLTLETVEAAPDGVTIGELDTAAAETLRVARLPEIIEATGYPHSPLIADLVEGDTVPVVIPLGWLDITADYRVVKWSLDPKTDQPTWTLNPV
jgi:hypothetical protein